MEVSDVRRRLRGAIEDARRRAAERRARVDEAAKAYEQFRTNVAIPLFGVLAQALAAEGLRYKVETPADSIRLVPDRPGGDFIEVALDSDRETPALAIRSSRGRGRRTISSERTMYESRPIEQISDEDLVTVLLEELLPFLER
jgi:hypothetical protein